MKYSMIKTAGLALFLLLVFGGCKFQPEGAEVHVVATTTDSQSEAVRLAESEGLQAHGLSVAARIGMLNQKAGTDA